LNPVAERTCFSQVRALCEKHEKGLAAYENGRLLHGRPRYVVELAAGLHCGWAIEGPVGSEHKVRKTPSWARSWANSSLS
jgi:hypothetical protein